MQLREGIDDLARPPIYISVSHDVAHPPHASSSFGPTHHEGFVDRSSDFVRSERIHQDGVAELPRGACEATENKAAIFVNAAGDEFLCNQVHSVVQRRDQAEVRYLV